LQHGVRIWQKKLTSSGAHNRALLLNQATDLVTNGRITTTVAKAKVLKHYAEKIINIAKQDNLTKLNKVRPETTVPKLQLLAARFADRTGGYTRLTLAGFNRPGSDRAPLATLEYVDSPND
ncbi:50S ribosomal protein L17, partial [Chytriomyces sp. MP71]